MLATLSSAYYQYAFVNLTSQALQPVIFEPKIHF